MSKKGGVPDAWDDDWETLADRPEAPSPAEPVPKLTKAQRRVQHQSQQKQLWDSAENPDRLQWLEAKGVVPLKQEFKPQVTLLSRNPVPSIAKRNLTDGLARLNTDDYNEDSNEESRKMQEAELEERQRKAKLEREEKQRRYAEARERIMGSPSAGSAAPVSSRESSHGRDGRWARGKIHSNRNSQPTSSADQSPSRPGAVGDKQLFDPDDMGRRLPKRESPAPPRENRPTRQPRGPENGGRGGFGFAQRGGRVGI